VSWVTFADSDWGTTSMLRPRRRPPAVLTPDLRAVDVATAFLVRYGALFQLVDPAHELAFEQTGNRQGTSVSFTQTEGGVSVFGTRVTVMFDVGGSIAFVSAGIIPNLYRFPTHAALSPAEAVAGARADMNAKWKANLPPTLEATPPPQLIIYAPRHGTAPKLGYAMRVSYVNGPAGDISRRTAFDYVIDANSGAILSAASTICT